MMDDREISVSTLCLSKDIPVDNQRFRNCMLPESPSMENPLLLITKLHPIFSFLLGGILPYLFVICVEIYPRNIQ